MWAHPAEPMASSHVAHMRGWYQPLPHLSLPDAPVQMGRAADLRMRAELALQAAEAVEAADAAEAELAALRSAIDAQLDAQLGLMLVRRKVRPGDLVSQYASGREVGHAGEMSKSDFRAMIKTLGVRLAGEASDASSPAWRAAVDGLFDTLDPDRSGFLDSNEAIAALQKLRDAASAADEGRSNKARYAAAMRRKSERLVRRALSKPGQGAGGPEGSGSPQQQLLDGEGEESAVNGGTGDEYSSANGLASSGGGGSFMGGLFSFRGGDPRVKQREEERKRAAKERAHQAMQRLPRLLLSRGWNG